MTTADIKECILALPIQERVVAVALKHIFHKLKEIEAQEDAQCLKIQEGYLDKFKNILEQSNKIITGEKIKEQYLSNIAKYCTEQERSNVPQIANNNKGIQAYWFTAILNYFKQSLTLEDKQIATAITNIKTNLSANYFEITFYFGQNDILSSAIITKRFISDENSDTLRIEGDNAQWLKGKPQGIFGDFLSEANPSQISHNYQLANQFINEIVPYSLQHFLDVAEQLGLEDEEPGNDGDEDEDSDGDEEQLKSESEPKKKTKK